MIKLNNAYQELFSAFPFSIKGYDDIEGQIETFFKSLSNSTTIKEMENVNFISLGYSQLKSFDPKWEVASLHENDFYNNSFKELSTELYLINDYYSFKSFLIKEIKDPLTYNGDKIHNLNDIFKNPFLELSTSKLATNLFIRPKPYRILLSDSAITSINFNKRLDVLSFEFSVNSIFKKEFTTVKDVRNKFSVLLEQRIQHIQSGEAENIGFILSKKDHKYTKKIGSEPFSFGEKLIDISKLRECIKSIVFRLCQLEDSRESKIFIKGDNKDIQKFYFESFAKLLISHAYLSMIFSSWVENIPSIVFIDEKNKEERCLGNLIIGYNSEEELSLEQRAFFRIVADRISSNLASQAVKEIVANLKKTSLKSSLAAVMARNMSHNIGSHVLNKLSDEKNVQQFFDRHNKKAEINPTNLYVKWVKGNPNKVTTQDDVYEISNFLIPHTLYDDEQVTKDEHPITKKEVEKFKNKRNDFIKYLQTHTTPIELTRVFNDYLKKRMDFVADVATANSTSIMSSKPIFSEVFKSFEKNLLLLAHISGKENVFKYKFNFTVNGNIFDPEKLDSVTEPLAAMPNDVLGSQAFCIILENIIRNTAKHAKIEWNVDTRIIFTIDVNTNYCDEFLKITIYDDSNNHMSAIPEDLIKKRNKSIKESVLTTENVLRAEGWGTIELKIAACYLSRLDLDKIDEPEFNPIMDESIGEGWEECKENNWRIKNEKTYYPILQAVEGVKTDKNLDKDNDVVIIDKVTNVEGLPKIKFFGYSFLIKKPKDLIIIDTKGVIEKSFDQPLDPRIYKNLGVEILTEIPKNLLSDNLYFYDILLVLENDESITKFRKVNKNKLPNRIVCLNNENLESPEAQLDESKNYKDYFNSLKTKCWQEITKKYEEKTDNYRISSKTNSFTSGKEEDPHQIFKFEHHAKDGIYLKDKKFYNASKKEINYYEPYGSSSGLNNFLESYKNKSTVQLQARMLEAICGKVAIIDERIQGVLKNTAYTAEGNEITSDIEESYQELKEITYSQLFQLTNIEVIPFPEDSVDKGVLLTGTLDIYSLKNINEFIKESKAAFVVIHFGIIESLRFGENETSIKALEKMLDGKPDETEIIITSGRGFTKDVQALCDDKYKFINYSAFSNYVIDPHNRSKMHLIHLLKSLRI